MRKKQANPKKCRRYKTYRRENLKVAYAAVKRGDLSVRAAARRYGLPRTTLRDRVAGRIELDAIPGGGAGKTFSSDNEKHLCEHLIFLAELGYAYTRQETIDLAAEYATHLGFQTKHNSLTRGWFEGFMRRWPELKVKKAQALEISRARCANEHVLTKYFDELATTIQDNNLDRRPDLIFNVDEKGITQNHKPPHIVTGVNMRPQAITSGKSQTVTIIGCGSASGQALPPYFVFAGKKRNPALLTDALPGTGSSVSETGWSNSVAFRQFLETHFLKHVRCDEKTLLVMDGHRSHISVDLIEWAKGKNIILFILPAHCSHIVQPLDVGIYGPLQRLYSSEAHKRIRETQGKITPYDICPLVCKIYNRAFSSSNLISGFRRAGLYPVNINNIAWDKVLKSPTVNPDHDSFSPVTSDDTPSADLPDHDSLPPVTSDHQPAVNQPSTSFFKVKERNVLSKIQPAKPRNTLSKVVSGKNISNVTTLDNIKKHVQQYGPKPTKEVRGKGTSSKGKRPAVPKPVPVTIDSDSDSDCTTDDPSDLCCVCKRFSPVELSGLASVHFTKWAQCDEVLENNRTCDHWTHLEFCTHVRVVRRADKFICPCHSHRLSEE